MSDNEEDKVLSADEVDVQGTTYKIVLLEDMISEDTQEGGLDVTHRVIYLDLGLEQPQARSEVLIHELTHCYCLKFGDATERQVIKITSAIFDFIRHNKKLALDLIEMAGKDWEDGDLGGKFLTQVDFTMLVILVELEAWRKKRRAEKADKPNVLKGETKRFGYRRVCLQFPINGKKVQKNKFVHNLVMDAFVGPKPDGYVCDHINGIKDDNRLENLEYVTPKENTRYAIEMGLSKINKKQCGEMGRKYGRRNGRAGSRLKENDVRNIRALVDDGMSRLDLCNKYGVNLCTIDNIHLRKTWSDVV